MNVSPVVALLAVAIGWIVIVPPFFSWYRTFHGVAGEASPVLGFSLYVIAVFMLPVEVISAQDELNTVWRARPTP